MATSYTADELIERVRREARIPNKAATGSQDADILQHLNDAMDSILVPFIRRTREEYFALTRRSPIVAGQRRYRIHRRSIGQQIRSVYFISGDQRLCLTRVDPGNLDKAGNVGSGNPTAFYLEGNHIVFVQQPLGGELEVGFYASPGRLVLERQTCKVASVNTAAKTITLATDPPASWEESATSFDVHSGLSGGELKQVGLTRADISGAVVTVAEAIDGSVHGTYQPEAGDYLCLEGEAAKPGVPHELQAALVQAACSLWHQAQGNLEAAMAIKNTLGEMLVGERVTLSSRVESHPPKMVSYNPLWGSRGRSFF